MKKTLEQLKAVLAGQIARLTRDQLVIAWNETEKNVYSAENGIIRGAIMDRLENEQPEQFWKWVDSDNGKIEEFF